MHVIPVYYKDKKTLKANSMKFKIKEIHKYITI